MAPEEKSLYNVYARNCPARQCFERLADRWAILIISRLRNGLLRFNQLKKEIDGISQKVLSQKLKQLERDGIVQRSVIASVPVTVEYQLTPLGHSYADTIDQIHLWAEQNVETVMAAQEKYDAALSA